MPTRNGTEDNTDLEAVLNVIRAFVTSLSISS